MTTTSEIDLAPFRPLEREALRPPDDLSVSEWAERYRVIVTGNEVGPWRNSRTPYLVGVMDAFSDPTVRKITLKKSVQSGGTEAAMNMLGYAIDQDPGDTIWAVPRGPDIGHFQFRRWSPVVEATEALSRHETGRPHDEKTKEHVFDRMALYIRAATSKADLASDPCRNVFGDELDKWNRWTEDEGDPVRLLEDRTTTYWNRRVVLISTPSTKWGHIHRAWLSSDRREFWVPCPRCGTFQVLQLERIKTHGEREPEKIRRERLATYACSGCDAQIEDTSENRTRMVADGKWVQDCATIDKAGRIRGAVESEHAGFHVSMLVAPWKTWSEIVARFFEVKDDPPELQVFVNQWLGEVFEDVARETTKEQLAKLQLPYPAGHVPAGAVVLVAGVDVQQDYFRVVVRAFGYDMESWLVWTGRVETWHALWTLLRQPWGKDPARFVMLANIDSGYETWDVYEECFANSDIARPVKGMNRASGLPYTTHRIQKNPNTGETLPGLVRWEVNTTFFKDKMSALQRTPLGDPGGWHLHRDTPDEHLEECAAEKKVAHRDRRTGNVTWAWEPKYVGAANHGLDCEVYALAAAHMLEVWTLRSDARDAAPRKRRRSKASSDDRRRRKKKSSWFDGLR